VAWSAVCALLLQLVVSFGHVHFHRGELSPAVESIVATADAQTPAAPAQDDDDAYCPECAFLALLAGAHVALPPLYPTPPLVYSAVLTASADKPGDCFRQLSFRSRAPPIA